MSYPCAFRENEKDIYFFAAAAFAFSLPGPHHCGPSPSTVHKWVRFFQGGNVVSCCATNDSGAAVRRRAPLLVHAAANRRWCSCSWIESVRCCCPPTAASAGVRTSSKVPRRGERAAQSALRSVALACAMSGHVQAAWACARARWHPEQLQRGLCPQPCTARGRARSSPWRLACGSAGAILEASLATPQPRCGASAAHRARPGARIRRLWCFPPSSRPSQPAPPHH